MKLHSPQFEKALRGSVRKTVRSDPVLRREAKKSRPSRSINPSFSRLIFTAILAGAVLWCADQTKHPAIGFAAINLWVLVVASYYAQRIWQHLHKANDLPALFFLPVSDETVFRWEFQKFLRGISFIFVDMTVALAAMCWAFHYPLVSWLAIVPVAALACAMCIALSLLCAVWAPALVYQMVILLTVGIGLIAFFLHDVFNLYMLPFMDLHAAGLNLWLPSGWPGSLFQLTTGTPQWIVLATLPLAALILATIKDSRRRLIKEVSFKEPTVYEAPDMIPADDTFRNGVPEHQPVQEKLHRVGLTTIREFIGTRQFLAPPDWPNAGWFERKLWRWFNGREKKLVEFAFPNGFTIGRPWRVAYRNLLITFAVAFVLGYVNPVVQVCALIAGCFFAVCQGLFQMQSGSAFRGIFCSGVNVPIYAAFSIGFRELAGMLFKCAAIQLPLLLLFTTLLGAGMACFFLQPVSFGILAGYKGGLLFFASRYLILMFGFSSGTNDNQAFRLRTLVMFLFIIASGLVFLFLGVLSFTVPAESIAWIFPSLAVLHGYLVFRTYGWFYHRNRFDLMRAS